MGHIYEYIRGQNKFVVAKKCLNKYFIYTQNLFSLALFYHSSLYLKHLIIVVNSSTLKEVS